MSRAGPSSGGAFALDKDYTVTGDWVFLGDVSFPAGLFPGGLTVDDITVSDSLTVAGLTTLNGNLEVMDWIAVGDPILPTTGRIRIGTGGTAGNYTLANSGIVWVDAAGTEQLRLWATDPTQVNFNADNLFIGRLAGELHPTDNVSSGRQNIGIGTAALRAISIGEQNIALGFGALQLATTAGQNVVIGTAAAGSLISGNLNTIIGTEAGTAAGGGTAVALTTDTDMITIGYRAGKSTASILTNSIAIGALAKVSASNQVVIGDMTTAMTCVLPATTAVRSFATDGIFAVVRSNGTLATPTSTVNGDFIGTNDYLGWITGTGQTFGVRLIAMQNGTVGAASVPCDFIIQVIESDGVSHDWKFEKTAIFIPPLLTVATLPAASSARRGARSTVSDANATLTAGIGAVVAGGGANVVPVSCDGAAWRIG